MKNLLKLLGILSAAIISIWIAQACIAKLYDSFIKSRYVAVDSEQDNPLW